MNDIEQLKQAKDRCIADISDALANYSGRLNSIDERLMIYIEDALSNNASHANLMELLGIRKTLRLMDSYKLDIPRARRKITAIEGQWKDGRHVKGGLKFSTPRGQQHVRLMPFQVYAECSIHMFVVDVCMERTYYDGDALLPSDIENETWRERVARLAWTELLPTPNTGAYRNAGSSEEFWEHRIEMGRQMDLAMWTYLVMKDYEGAKDGDYFRCNPQFWEETMGFPKDWTLLPFQKGIGEPKPSKPTETPSSPK